MPGSLGNEAKDAGDWQTDGVSYLRYVNCGNGSPEKPFTTMAGALSDKKIFYSTVNWGQFNDFGSASEASNSWWITSGVDGSFYSLRQAFYTSLSFNTKPGSTVRSGPGAWADLGTMFLGVNNAYTIYEEQTHFAMWAFAKSPLFLSVDLPAMAPELMQIVTNKALIALNQDSIGLLP